MCRYKRSLSRLWCWHRTAAVFVSPLVQPTIGLAPTTRQRGEVSVWLDLLTLTSMRDRYKKIPFCLLKRKISCKVVNVMRGWYYDVGAIWTDSRCISNVHNIIKNVKKCSKCLFGFIVEHLEQSSSEDVNEQSSNCCSNSNNSNTDRTIGMSTIQLMKCSFWRCSFSQ